MARIRLTIDLDTHHGDISEETLEAIGAVNLRSLMMDALREFQTGRGVNAREDRLNLEMARCYVEKRYTHETPNGETRTFGEWGSERFEKKALQVARRSHVSEFIANNIESIGFDEPDDSTGNVVEQLADVLAGTELLDAEDFKRANNLLRTVRGRSRKEHFPYMHERSRDLFIQDLRRFLEHPMPPVEETLLKGCGGIRDHVPANVNYHRFLVGNVIKWVDSREPMGTRV